MKTIAPSSRIKNCIGTCTTALKSNPRRLSLSEPPAIYRCTWDWSAPKYDSARKKPPINPDQNVYRLCGSTEKLTASSFPILPATDRVFSKAVSYTHLRAHETPEHLVCRL